MSRLGPHAHDSGTISPSVAQGRGGLYYAGAWAGYGFHEDGLKAGMAAAQLLGASVPWTPRPTSPKLSLAQRCLVATFDRFARAALSAGRLRFILPNGEELCYGSEASAAQHGPPPGVPGLFSVTRDICSACVCAPLPACCHPVADISLSGRSKEHDSCRSSGGAWHGCLHAGGFPTSGGDGQGRPGCMRVFDKAPNHP